MSYLYGHFTGTYQRVMVVKDCLHRFCSECIEKWLRSGHKDCPKCRNQIPSRRSLRPDPIFERMIRRLFPNVKEFEEKNDCLVAEANKRKSLVNDVDSDQSLSARPSDFNHVRPEPPRPVGRPSGGRRGRPPGSTSARSSSVGQTSEPSQHRIEVFCVPDRTVDILKSAQQKKLQISSTTKLSGLSNWLIQKFSLHADTKLIFSRDQVAPPSLDHNLTIRQIQPEQGAPLILHFTTPEGFQADDDPAIPLRTKRESSHLQTNEANKKLPCLYVG